MISVHEAERIVFQHGLTLAPVSRPLAEAHGMVLREDIAADRDLPPFDRVTMDGIALSVSALRGGPRFAVEGTQRPGEEPLALKDPRGCFQVMTGAPLPGGCNCVVPFEQVTIEGDTAVLQARAPVQRMQYVHRHGEDRKQGEIVLHSGAVLLSPQIAIIAAVGRASVFVSSTPRVAIVSTGDELVDLEATVTPYQARRSNSFALRSALRSCAASEVHLFHVRDDAAEIEARLRDVLAAHDLLILSGGVSMGRYDHVPAVLDKMAVKRLFHKVRQRPGKPMWFGVSRDNKPVFALPGNPVSAMVCFHRYLLPSLRRAMRMILPMPESALLARKISFDEPLTFFPPVRVRQLDDGRLSAAPVAYHGSGDFTALGESDGFVELPEDQEEFPEGTLARFHRWMC